MRKLEPVRDDVLDEETDKLTVTITLSAEIDKSELDVISENMAVNIRNLVRQLQDDFRRDLEEKLDFPGLETRLRSKLFARRTRLGR